VLVLLFWVQVVLALVLTLFTQLEPLWANYAEFRRMHPGARVTFAGFFLGTKKTTERLLTEAANIPHVVDIAETQAVLDDRIVQERIESRDVAQLNVLVKLQYTLSRELQRLQKGRSGDKAFADASNRLLKNVFASVGRVMNYSSDHGGEEMRRLLTELNADVTRLWGAWKRGCGKVDLATGSASKVVAKARRGTTLGKFFEHFSGSFDNVRRSIVGPIKIGPDASVMAWQEEYRHASSLLDTVLKDLKDLARSMARTHSVNDRLSYTFVLVAVEDGESSAGSHSAPLLDRDRQMSAGLGTQPKTSPPRPGAVGTAQDDCGKEAMPRSVEAVG